MTTVNLTVPTIITKHWRGTYVARLTEGVRGPSRDFLSLRDVGKVEKLKTGGSRRVYRILEPGWYEVREGYATYRGQPTPKTVYRVTSTTVERMPDTFDLLTALQGPNPGEPGEYFGDKCECGEPVETFDRDGWPHCADHPARNYDAPWAAKGMQVPA